MVIILKNVFLKDINFLPLSYIVAVKGPLLVISIFKVCPIFTFTFNIPHPAKHFYWLAQIFYLGNTRPHFCRIW